MQKVKGKEHLEIREHWEIAFHIFLLNSNLILRALRSMATLHLQSL